VLTNATGLPLTTGVTGTLGVANGGTGAATLTANNVLLGNGTSAVQFVAPGTSGNVLTSNGTTWASSTPAAGALTLISTQTANNTSQYLNFTGISGYNCYMLVFNDLITTSTTAINAQFGTGGTPTWQTSNYYWTQTRLSGSAASTSSSTTGTYLPISGAYNQPGTGTSYSLIGSMLLSNLSSTSMYKSSSCYINVPATSGVPCGVLGFGEWYDTTAVTGVRIDGGGTLVSGSVSLYGIST
jgi:hypothetical protein